MNRNKTKGKRNRRVNQVKIGFTNKPITAWGGIATLVAKYLETIQFREWVEAAFPLTETSNNGRGIYEKVLAQLLTVLAGGTRFWHLSWWGHGVEVMQRAFGVAWLPAAASTLTRFWGKINRQSEAEKVGEFGRQMARRILENAGVREDNLNFDSTVLTRYGQQEGARKGYNPKKRGRPSHHPLVGFVGAGYVVNLWNRRGDSSARNGIIDFFRQTVAALGIGFRVRRVLCDSGFYEIDFLRLLEGAGYRYIIVAPAMEILQKRIRAVPRWAELTRGIDVAEFRFVHQDKKWGPHERRYVAVRQLVSERPRATGKQLRLFRDDELLREYRYSLMVTNDEETAAADIWRLYRPRAADENVLKDLKEGYGFAAFNMDQFWATEAVMVMNALVYHNLVHYLNRHVLNAGQPSNQLQTLRSKYLIIPAMLGSGGRYAVLRLGVSSRKLRAKLDRFLVQISLLPLRLNCNAVET
jgi:hypothetical protein